MGSGAELNREYDRYARAGKSIDEYFKKEILFDFDSFEEMNRKEIELVNDILVSDPMSYNRRPGGNFSAVYPKGCIVIEHDGKTGLIRDWSEWTGISPNVIRARLKKGMSMAEIMSIPPRQRDKVWFNNSGEGHTIYEWCAQTGLKYDRVSARLRAGLSIDEALTDEKFNVKKYRYKGRDLTTAELEKIAGIKPKVFLARLRYGWSVEKAAETPLMPNPVGIWE